MYWTLHNRGSWNIGLQRPLPSKKSLTLFVHHFVHFFWNFVLVNQSLRLKHLQLQSTASSLAPSTCKLKKETRSSSRLLQPGVEQYQYCHFIIIAVSILKDLSLFLLSKSTRQDMRPASRRKPPETKKLTLYCSVASKIQPGYMLDC